MLRTDSAPVKTANNNHALRNSLLLHVAVLGLIIALPYLHRPPEEQPPRIVEAVLVRASAPSPRPPVDAQPAPITPPVVKTPEPVALPPAPTVTKAEPIKPSKIELPTAKPKPEHQKPVPVEKPPVKPEPKPAEKKPAPAKPLIQKQKMDTRDFENEMQAVRRQDDQQSIRGEAAKNSAAVIANANKGIVEKYIRQINQQVTSKWNRPLSARNGMEVMLRITVLPGGEVDTVVIAKSSGNTAFDSSAVNAVHQASPLQVPNDVAVFNNNFRAFNFKFHPEDL
jgi:colicin import membrane protein